MTSFAHNHPGGLPQRARRPIEPIAVVAGSLALSALSLASYLLVARPSAVPVAITLLLSAFTVLAERRSIRVSPNLEITVSLLVIVFTAVAIGPGAAMVVGAVGVLADLRPPYLRWFVWTCWRALAGGLAGIAASVVLSGGSSFGRLFVAVAVAGLVFASIDAVVGGLVVAARGTGTFVSFLVQVRPILLGTVPLYAPLIFLLVYAYQHLSAWSLFLFLVPALAAQRLHCVYREQRETTEQLSVANERLERASLSFATALVAALDARDQYTAGHSAAVAIYARDIAKRMGVSEEDQQLAHLCGLVHDVGKVGLPPGLLEKPGSLTLEERRRMEEHSEIGERILANVEDYAEIAHIVRHHHERMDGNGYPDGLTGHEIPLVSRILAVADAYNAMTSGRPYREAMPSRVARFRLAQAAGTQFDTSVVAAFEAILATSSETYLAGVRPDFAFEAQRQPALVPQTAAIVA